MAKMTAQKWCDTCVAIMLTAMAFAVLIGVGCLMVGLALNVWGWLHG